MSGESNESGLGCEDPMVELVAIVIGIFSAGIFVAHAVDAYQAQGGQQASRTAIFRR